MGHGRGNTMDEAAVAHLPSEAWWLFSCLVTSVLARVLAGHHHQEMLLLQKLSGQPPLPSEMLSIVTLCSQGMAFEAELQMLFSSLKAWALWRLVTQRPLFFPPSCSVYETSKDWNRREAELPVKTSPLNPKGFGIFSSGLLRPSKAQWL